MKHHLFSGFSSTLLWMVHQFNERMLRYFFWSVPWSPNLLYKLIIYFFALKLLLHLLSFLDNLLFSFQSGFLLDKFPLLNLLNTPLLLNLPIPSDLLIQYLLILPVYLSLFCFNSCLFLDTGPLDRANNIVPVFLTVFCHLLFIASIRF